MGMIQAPNQTPADRLDRMVRQYEKDLLRICCVYLRDRSHGCGGCGAGDLPEGLQESGFLPGREQRENLADADRYQLLPGLQAERLVSVH